MRWNALPAVAVVTTLCVSATVAAAKQKSVAVPSLDGAVFHVDLFDENGRNGGFDQFVFVDGKISSAEMRELGCWPVGYKLKPGRGNAAQFEAIFTTADDQPVRVRGVVKGDLIEGTILWSEGEGSSPWTYTGRRFEGPLDGSHFRIELTPDDEESLFPRHGEDDGEDPDAVAESSHLYAFIAELEQGEDVLSFRNGGFVSRSCIAVGITMTDYSAERYEEQVTFAAQAAAEHAGAVQWTGNVEGDRIEGTLKWTAPDGSVVRFSFVGSRITG